MMSSLVRTNDKSSLAAAHCCASSGSHFNFQVDNQSERIHYGWSKLIWDSLCLQNDELNWSEVRGKMFVLSVWGVAWSSLFMLTHTWLCPALLTLASLFTLSRQAGDPGRACRWVRGGVTWSPQHGLGVSVTKHHSHLAFQLCQGRAHDTLLFLGIDTASVILFGLLWWDTRPKKTFDCLYACLP